MIRRKGRLRFPCERCGKKFERFGREKLCGNCRTNALKIPRTNKMTLETRLVKEKLRRLLTARGLKMSLNKNELKEMGL
jgi:hypothetical protein